MSIIGNPTFTVKFNLTGAPVLTLTDTTSTPPSGMTGFFTITQPDGITTTSTSVGIGGVYNHTLRLDSGGGVQMGSYTIVFSAPGYYDSNLTRTFYFDYYPALLKPTSHFDPFVPSLIYTDETSYTVSNWTPSGLTRSWSGTSTPTGTITSSLQSLDLEYNGDYWAANYTIVLTSTLTYTNNTNSWLTVEEGLTKTVTDCVSNPKTLAEMTDKVNDLLFADNCDDTNKNFEKGQTLIAHFIDQLRLQQISNIPQTSLFETYKQVVNFLWGGYSCNPDNQPLVAYDFADYVNSSIYTDYAAFGFLVGDGINTCFTVNHNLGTDYPVVQIYDAISKVQLQTGYTVTIVSSNSIDVCFDFVPSLNEYLVIIHSGADHLKGREVQIQVSGGYIQWKYDSDVTWTNLVALDDLTPKVNVGDTNAVAYDQPAAVTNSGDDFNVVLDFDIPKGVPVQIRSSGGYIQWKYADEITWNNLVAYSDIDTSVDLGTVTVLNPNQNPTIVNSGTNTDAVFDFGVPRAASVSLGTVSTGTAGSNVSITNSGSNGDVVLNFTIPRGDTGYQVNIRYSSGYIQWKYSNEVSWTNLVPITDLDATVTLGSTTVVNPNVNPSVSSTGTANDAIFSFSLPRAAAVSVGTTTTLSPGSSATVSNSGSNGDVVLNFGVPKGDASTVTVGTTTTVNPNVNPSVANSGTTSAAILDFSLPRASAVSVGTTTTGSSGSSASVTNSGSNGDTVLNFTIPRGDAGKTIVSDTAPSSPYEGLQWFNSSTGETYIYYDSTWVQDSNTTVAVGPTGATGASGVSATVAVGSTTTGNAGTNASVTNSGTNSAAVLNFTIPRGADGAAATVAVGSTTTGNAGTSASVTNSGTTSAAVLNFTIPKGDTGATGATGPSNPSSTLFAYYNFI